MHKLVRALTVCALIVSSLAAPTASASASASGALKSAFESYFTGGLGNFYAFVMRGGVGYLHAANGVIDFETGAARISPIVDSTHCSSNVFGIWVFLAGPDRAGLAEITFDMSFGPAGGPLSPLVNQESATKRVVDPQGVFVGAPFWWRSVVVPVYGSLGPGNYELSWSSNVFGANTVNVTVEDC